MNEIHHKLFVTRGGAKTEKFDNSNTEGIFRVYNKLQDIFLGNKYSGIIFCCSGGIDCRILSEALKFILWFRSHNDLRLYLLLHYSSAV